MADFAPNYTARYKLHYSVLGKNHVMMWRIERGTGQTGLALTTAKVETVLNQLAPIRFTNFLVQNAEYAPEDVDIFSPANIPSNVTPGAVAIPTDFLSQSIVSISFIGRSTGGQKTRMFLFGTASAPELGGTVSADNFRITTVEQPAILGAVNALNSGNPQIPGNDNLPALWYSYVNVKYNDHWIRKIRA